MKYWAIGIGIAVLIGIILVANWPEKAEAAPAIPDGSPAPTPATGTAPSTGTTSSTLNTGLILAKGSKGAEVRELQSQLNARGASPVIVVDGVFGKLTEIALKAVTGTDRITLAALPGKVATTTPRPQEQVLVDEIYNDITCVFCIRKVDLYTTLLTMNDSQFIRAALYWNLMYQPKTNETLPVAIAGESASINAEFFNVKKQLANRFKTLSLK